MISYPDVFAITLKKLKKKVYLEMLHCCLFSIRMTIKNPNCLIEFSITSDISMDFKFICWTYIFTFCNWTVKTKFYQNGSWFGDI